MARLSGTIDEWEMRDDGRWLRPDHPEDGVITLREGLTFAEYYAKRAKPEPPPEPSPIEKIAALEARLDALERKT